MTTIDSGSPEDPDKGDRAREDRAHGAQMPTDTSPGIDPRLLELLVCPVTRGPLVLDRTRGELLSRQAGLAYPIRDGIAIMLADEARPLEDEERRRLGKASPTAGS